MQMLVRSLILVAAAKAVLAEKTLDPASDQIVIYGQNHERPDGIMTTTSGAPIFYTDATDSLNSDLIENQYLMDALAVLDREKVPERVVHAKGGGAFGYFEVTRDMSYICKADLFNEVGKRTPVAVRFSSVIPERGGSDMTRDNRGYSVKFYTQEGNFDIVGLATPVFVIKDPVKFCGFTHAASRNPSTNLLDANSLWDFLTLNPESLHDYFYIFGDRGIPAGYSYMPGFGVHTYQIENNRGDIHFVRFHFMPDAGIKNLTTEEARRIGADDLDYHNRILYRDIANGKFPSWTVSVQVLTLDDVKKSDFDVFDVTREIPLYKHPLQEVGKLVLNRNPVNYYADIEQLAYGPGNLVPGILGDPSKLFQARRLAYRDAQTYRLGGNFNKIHVNCPYRTKTLTYFRDGEPPVKDNGGSMPSYYPNSFGGPVPYMATHKSQLIKIKENSKPNNFDQITELYKRMTNDEQRRLVKNIVYSLSQAATFLQNRALAYFEKIHPELGRRIAQGLKGFQGYKYGKQ